LEPGVAFGVAGILHVRDVEDWSGPAGSCAHEVQTIPLRSEIQPEREETREERSLR